MSKTIFFTALSLCTLLFAACQQTPKPKPATAAELSKMNQDFVKALNAKDAVAAANCYTEDAVLLPPKAVGRPTFKNIGPGPLKPAL